MYGVRTSMNVYTHVESTRQPRMWFLRSQLPHFLEIVSLTLAPGTCLSSWLFGRQASETFLVSASLAPRLQRAHRHTFIILKNMVSGYWTQVLMLAERNLIHWAVSPAWYHIVLLSNYQCLISLGDDFTFSPLGHRRCSQSLPSLCILWGVCINPEILIWGDKWNRKISSGKCCPCYNSIGKPSSSLLACHCRRVECFQGQPFLPTTL